MKAILLAGGYGKRLLPLTLTTPKCLVPICGTPLLDIWFKRLSLAGIESFLVNTHYLAHKVEQHVLGGAWSDRVTLSHENELLGTAGTLLANRAFIGKSPVMLIHADNLSVFDVKAFIAAHHNRPARCDMTMMLFNTDVPHSCGIVQLDQEGVVTAFYEKVQNPPSTLANGAVYILEASLVEECFCVTPPITDFSNEVIPRRLGRIFTFLNDVYHRDIGNLHALKLANHEYKSVHF